MGRHRPRTLGPRRERLDSPGTRRAHVLQHASGGLGGVLAGRDEARSRRWGDRGVLLGVKGHEEAGMVGERMRVRSRQRGDCGGMAPTAHGVSSTAQ